MSLPAVNVLLILFGPGAIAGVIWLLATTGRAEQAKAAARVGELQVKAAERERKGVSR